MLNVNVAIINPGRRDMDATAGIEDRCREETVINDVYKHDLFAADFLISVFVSALHSYRHDTVLRPFPMQFTSTLSSEKDFNLLERCVERFLRLPDIDKGDVDDDCKSLIKWITEPRNFHLRTLSTGETDSLRGQLEDSSQWCSPERVFEVVPCAAGARRFEELRAGRAVFLSYHGTRIENLHSILHHGLVSHMNKNGLYGEGTYLSTAISISLHYSPTGRGWRDSCLGEKLSCVAVCEVIDDQSVKCHTTDVKRSRIADSEGGSVPEKYYVATNNEMVRVRYLLVYTHTPSVTRPQHNSAIMSFIKRHKFACLMVFYLCVLVFIGLNSSKSFFSRQPRF